MPNIRNISSKQILKFLLKEGFTQHHKKGSHIQLRKNDKFVTVPFHGKKTLKIKTTISILRQAGVDKDYFLDNV